MLVNIGNKISTIIHIHRRISLSHPYKASFRTLHAAFTAQWSQALALSNLGLGRLHSCGSGVINPARRLRSRPCSASRKFYWILIRTSPEWPRT